MPLSELYLKGDIMSDDWPQNKPYYQCPLDPRRCSLWWDCDRKCLSLFNKSLNRRKGTVK